MRGLLSRCIILTGLVIFIMSLSYFPGVPLPAFGLDVIIDNNTSESSKKGKWGGSGGGNYYGTKSEWSKTVGSTYTFETSFPGETMELEVYEYHTYYSSRCTNTQHLITDSSGAITTIPVNQKVNGGTFNKLGTWTFKDYARVMIIVQYSSCSQNADAIKFMSLLPSTAVCPCFNSAEIQANMNDAREHQDWSYQEYKFNDYFYFDETSMSVIIDEDGISHEYTVTREHLWPDYNYCVEKRYSAYDPYDLSYQESIDYYPNLTEEVVSKCEDAILESGIWQQFQ